MRTTTTHRYVAAAIIGAASLALTACGPSGASSPSSAPTASATASNSGVSSSGSSSTGAGAGSPTQAQNTSQSGDQAAGNECTTSQLKAAAENGDAGAGQHYFQLVFTNISSKTCTLAGYPGVSYVKGGDVQVGNPAQHEGGTPVTTVTLRPGGTASAVVHDTNGTGGYDPSQCQLTPVEGLRVYPPNQKTALFVANNTEHCAGTGINPLSVQAIKG